MENLGDKETEQEAKRTEPGPSIDLNVVVVVSKLERSHDFCASLDAKQLMREGEEKKIIAKFYVIWRPPTRHIDETFFRDVIARDFVIRKFSLFALRRANQID